MTPRPFHPDLTRPPVWLPVAAGLLWAGLVSAAQFPSQVGQVEWNSSVDGSSQLALFYAPPDNPPRPLLVALHSWSGDFRQTSSVPYAEWCLTNQWIFIHPNFRGPNHTPDACASDLAVADVGDAVAYAKAHASVDGARIYLVGVSGGGHMALVMAGRAPELWTAVSAWVPIHDLPAWHAECRASQRHYADELELVCGGPPGHSPAVDEQYRRRSPKTHLAKAIGLPLDINAGIRDGHDGSVPISHALHAFNQVAAAPDRIREDLILEMTRTAKVPPVLQLKQEELHDPDYGGKQPLFRRSSGTARVTLFDGGHELLPQAALHWLARQRK